MVKITKQKQRAFIMQSICTLICGIICCAILDRLFGVSSVYVRILISTIVYTIFGPRFNAVVIDGKEEVYMTYPLGKKKK